MARKNGNAAKKAPAKPAKKAAPKVTLLKKLVETAAPAGPIGSMRKTGLNARHFNPGAGGKVNFGR